MVNNNKSRKRVLVAGASGYLGHHLVKELKDRGVFVRVLVRKKEQSEYFKNIADDIWIAQATLPETLKEIAVGMDYVFSSLGITKQKDGLKYEDVDYKGNLNLLNESLKSGVKKFLYVSVAHAEMFPDLEIIKAKEKFVRQLKNAPIEHIIIRPSGFFSDLKEILQMAQKGRVWLLGSGNYRVNPISGRDLARVCWEATQGRQTEVEAGGPKIYSHNEIANHAFSALGIKPVISYIPLWPIPITLFLLRHFTPQTFYGPIEFFLNALQQDMITPRYGKDLLEDFYKEKSEEIKNELVHIA